jgi:uracil-DNA glycosylase family 4
MSLDLDTRQRAMLREMGVHVWLPEALPRPANLVLVPEDDLASFAIQNVALEKNIERAAGQYDLHDAGVVIPTAVPSGASQPLPAPAAAHRKPVVLAAPGAGPTTVTTLAPGIDRMSWPELAEAVAHCQGCAMCFGRRAPVLAAPDAPTPCDWLVVGDPPDEAQERLGLPFVEEAGLLLDNMLRAVGVQRFLPLNELDGLPEKRAYLTHVLKCRPELMRAPDATELATCANYLRREIALTQPKVILAMGRFAMQVLLGDTPPESAKLPLGKLRGQVWQFAGVPLVVTYPPAYLLRSGQDKGKAWADLCLALDVAQGKLPG